MTRFENSDPITITVKAAGRATGLGRTTLYRMMKSEEIASLRVGARRLIVFSSLKSRLSALPACSTEGDSNHV